ncbi:MAG: 7-cyano-7-deazaguanine synthase QueC [Methanobacteriota archaeon]
MESTEVKKAVCLISGGLDSAVTAFIAKDVGYTIYALTFDYGQRHIRELACAKKIAEAVGAAEHKIITIDLRALGGSALTDEMIDVPDAGGEGIPPTYVPARNTIMLAYCLAWAEVVEADAVYIGVNSVDYSGYPDCRPEYIQAFQEMANLATKRAVEGNPVKIETPLINLSKKDIIEIGVKLGVPFEHTWSCYRGGELACGTCDSCTLRKKGFKEAGVEDPIGYDDKKIP